MRRVLSSSKCSRKGRGGSGGLLCVRFILLVFLQVIFAFAHAFLELGDGAAERARELRDAVRAKEKECQGSNDEPVDRSYILEHKLTQHEAAEELGVDQPQVSRLLNGNIDLFTIDKLLIMLSRVKMRVK